MKKIVSSIICIVILLISGASVFSAEPLNTFKMKIVDKNKVVIQNALITICPSNKPKDEDYRYFKTDANGEIRILKESSGIAVGEYNITVTIPTIDKPKTETVKVKLTAQNTKKLLTINLALENQNQALFKAKKRTDLYLRNSKNGNVRNMKIQLVPTFDIPQTGTPGAISQIDPFAYTNDSGRVTFVNVAVGEYKVEYSWLGGKSSGGKISISDIEDVSSFVLYFDETRLSK